MKKVLLLLTFFVTAVSVQADTKSQRQKNYNLKNNLAIEGYDPVAYFSNKSVEGNRKYSYTYDGITYRFSSAANLEKFKVDPAKYEPQYGGWCAYAFSTGKDKVDIDPETFKVVGGKLYLFYNGTFVPNTLKKWNAKPDKPQIKKADAVWERLNK